MNADEMPPIRIARPGQRMGAPDGLTSRLDSPMSGGGGGKLMPLGGPELGGLTQDTSKPFIAKPGGPRPIRLPEDPQTSTDLSRLNDEKNLKPKIWRPGGAGGIKNPILRTLARIGDVAGTAMFPSITGNIPGTALHHKLEVQGAQRNYNQDIANQDVQSQTAERNAEAEAKLNPVPKDETGKTGDEITLHDLMTGENGNPRVNPQTGKPYTYLEAYTAVKQAAQDTKPEKPAVRATRDIQRVVHGRPHTIVIDDQTGADIKDEGETKLPGESADQKRNAAESAQVEREARQNIRKAADQYRATQQSVGQLQASIDAARDGNGLLTSFVPTMEVLGINASNGVHRISPAEAQAAGLPGGWVERFNAFFDKASKGKLSAQLQSEGKALAGILAKSAYQRYKSTYDDESGIVSGYGGTDFNKRVPLIPGEEEPNTEGNNRQPRQTSHEDPLGIH